MNVSVIGTGYVGLVVGAGLADFGLNVTCVDSDTEKIDQLNSGAVPIYEPGLRELIHSNLECERLSFSANLKSAVVRSLVIFLTVGTPNGIDGQPDLSQLEKAAEDIAQYMDDYKAIVIKSTVPVGTNRRLAEIIKIHKSNDFSFDVVSNPEFLREGSAVENFMRPNRVVIGASSDQAIAIMKEIYQPLYLIETPFVVTNPETAEMIKYACNAFLATKISFINEIANLCERLGADVHVVAKAMGLDGRIGPKFLHPGPGFGGSCFPKDVVALRQIARSVNYDFKIIDAVIETNKRQRQLVAQKIEDAVGDLKGKTVGVLGLSFKPNTDDVREAPSIDIIRFLLSKGAKVKVYDPAAIETAKAKLDGAAVEYCRDPYQSARGSHALAIMTEWNEFRNLDLARIKQSLAAPVIIDARNIYDPAKMKTIGFRYSGVGRG